MPGTVIKEQRGASVYSIIDAVRGDTFVWPYRARHDDGTPRDLSGSSFEFEVRFSEYDNDGDPLITADEFLLGQSQAAIDYDIAQGNPPHTTMDEVHVKMLPATMEVPAGEWRFDFRETTDTGDRRTRDLGTFIIAESIGTGEFLASIEPVGPSVTLSIPE